MILSSLKIHQLRNLSAVQLQLNPRFNFIVGANGSGKTSLLEALYLLSCGHSFRSREIAPIIAIDSESLTVFARSTENETISIQKANALPTQIKLNQQHCSATSQLAYALPCHVVYADIFQIIDAGSAVRRTLLDWGMFHVEHSYLGLLKEYKRVLKQRNALLKQAAAYELFIPWDTQLSLLAEQLHLMRYTYFCAWKKQFEQVLPQLTDTQCTLRYYKGWDKKEQRVSLAAVLEGHFASDKQRQFTQYGAHYADIIIDATHSTARHSLSRGQQKIILIALKLAQGALLKKDCLYLFDDLPAELDGVHQNKLLSYLALQKGQYVITSTQTVCEPNIIRVEEQSHFILTNGQFSHVTSR